MMKIISSLKHGVKLNRIGRIIEIEAKKDGYTIIQNLCSHGIGKSLHEAPTEILPVYNKHDKRVLKEGMVITIETFLSTEAGDVVEQGDGWTLSMPDNGYGTARAHHYDYEGSAHHRDRGVDHRHKRICSIIKEQIADAAAAPFMMKPF
ncbi:M24 family metallopeptidase [Paenibacillus sp. D9]|uniref:M24 family metallopeptidase n=1 Tax=Paenibacillus sp. D9 TaxID=665792 RepID=UPI001E4BB39A|nr:M24 family metallopeptidase [Paenibacillus sp. D9]